MDDLVGLIYIAILIALTAFFVVSEFAIVKVRSSRIDQLIEEGRRSAIAAKKVITNLDEYLSACQLGITVTALGIGWIGESTFEGLLSVLFVNIDIPSSVSHVLSLGLAFIIMTFLHVVVGELAPKTLAIQKAEQVTLLFSRPLILFYRIMYPFIWVLNGSARLITKAVGLKPASESENVHTEEELRIILTDSFKNGEINQSEFKYVNNIFEFDNRIAKEIMVPRTEIVSLDINDSIESLLTIARNEKFTRYPIIDGDKDHIIGLINIKEILTAIISGQDLSKQTIQSYMRPIIRVIDTVPIHDLLLKMQKEQIHMAILFDEYGGTSGLVTVEDIVEEIVGEIRDEFDLDEIPLIRQLSDNHYIFDAKVLVSEVNDLLNLNINDEDVDTIGGWILTENFEAKQGDTLSYEDFQFHILEMEDHHIKYVEVKKIQLENNNIKQPISLRAANSEAI
ncbi:hemolysin family protein [Caldibacillus lycopersici]|uniref:Hemolysin family protein n=1 Tax=Perspicuibacillus lycopersici TaxID=1325689 RepID=A0AAE3LPN8_9BACI|nr:hemolysin family protein [Perspicuibacillus lycopersici]MCU9615147.1 hemolysin family protein [Perspicuibacillus lycopersici]